MAFKRPVIQFGTIIAFGSNTVPEGYLLCNGSPVSRTTYAALFAAIGITYGEGDGSSTFNLPDMSNRFLEGTNDYIQYKAAGLPEIWGDTGYYTYNSGNPHGAFSSDTIQSAALEGGNDERLGYYNLYISANRCNSIYGSSDTVQPSSLKVRMCIKY